MSEEHVTLHKRHINGGMKFFKKRSLKFIFSKIPFDSGAPRNFADGSNMIILEGHRAQVSININSGGFWGGCSGSIINVDDALINELSTLGMYPKPTGTINKLTIMAGNDWSPKKVQTFSKVFEGCIDTAAADYNNQPDPAFIFTATAGGGLNLLPCVPVSFSGEVKVVDIFKTIIANINHFSSDDNPLISSFENLGVDSIEKNPYYFGDGRRQLSECAENNNVDMILSNGVLTIWPKNAKGPKNTVNNKPIILSYLEGTIGYPRYSQQGIIVETVYRNDLSFTRPYYIDSNIKKASGRYEKVVRITHNLTCNTSEGPWSSEIELSTFGTIEGFGASGN